MTISRDHMLTSSSYASSIGDLKKSSTLSQNQVDSVHSKPSVAKLCDRRLVTFVFELLIVILLITLSYVLKYDSGHFPIYNRSFHCSDETLNQKFAPKPEPNPNLVTLFDISDDTLHLVTFLGPIIAILICELMLDVISRQAANQRSLIRTIRFIGKLIIDTI